MNVGEVESGGRLFEFCYVPHHHRACVTRSAFCAAPPIDETPPCARAPTPTGGAQSFPSAVFGGVQPTSLAFCLLQLS
jgi:hypothetical protein